jgi:hypothetical protein
VGTIWQLAVHASLQSCGILVSPRDTRGIEEIAGTGDRHVDQPRLGRTERPPLPVVVGRRRLEPQTDPDPGPFTALRLVRGGHRYLRLILSGEEIHGTDNRVRPVCVNQLDDRPQVLAGRVVLGVILDLAPA